MDILFFVIFPIAVILISIVLQRILRSPILVAILVFAVFLILAYTAFTPEFVLNALIYAIIAFITAYLFRLICYLKDKINCPKEAMCPGADNNLEEAVEGLQDSIGTLEDNISDLNNLLSQALGNNNCGCNRRIKR